MLTHWFIDSLGIASLKLKVIISPFQNFAIYMKGEPQELTSKFIVYLGTLNYGSEL